MGKTGSPSQLLEGKGAAVALTEEKHEGERAGPFITDRMFQPATHPLQDGTPPSSK